MTARLRYSAPLLPVRDVRASTEFYKRHLGFAVDFIADDASHGIVSRDGATVHLQGMDGNAQALAVTAEWIAMYVEVDDVDALWAEVNATNPPTQTRAPFDQPYGMREFHIKDPDGFLIFFGMDAPSA